MSKIEVNTIDVASGSTITLGSAGKTVSIASGASTTGMGRSGTVDWQTTIKTESFTAVNGEGYFVNTADSGSPFKNYATTVASGTLYGGGSGNIFKLDGSSQQAITFVKGKTYRFTQSDASNDGHPLIISTSNSGTLSTFKAGIVSSGITYNLDGASNQTNYTNTTTFNAATTRYIEFQPQSTGTYYFGCWVHGIGMGGAITVQQLTITLPASPSSGDIISVKDYSRNFGTEQVSISRNGSNLDGAASDSSLTTDGLSVTYIYMDSTKGWSLINDDTTSQIGAQYISASGGNTTATAPCGNYKLHTFTGPGTFTVSCAGNSAGSNSVEYIIVGGGGAGGGRYLAGGGGAGGFRFASPSLAPITYPAKPLAGSNVTVSAQAYPIVVGAGGTGNGCGGATDSTPGSVSSGLGLTSAGGGAGKQDQPGNLPNARGGSGGSGGGGSVGNPSGNLNYKAGSGNTPPVSPPQGNDGGSGNQTSAPGLSNICGANFASCNPYVAGGGGGAIARGDCGVRHPSGAGNAGTVGNGGAGAGVPIYWGTAGQSCGGQYYFAGGGGGSGTTCTVVTAPGTGAVGGGGPGNRNGSATAGTTNTGGGGGGTDGRTTTGSGGNGGSGIVIIRYKFQ